VISIIVLILEEKISSSSPSGFYIHERLSIRERSRQELCIALTDHFFARGSSPVRTEEKNLNFIFFFFFLERRKTWIGEPLRLCGRRSRIATLRKISRPSSFAKEGFFFYCFAGTRFLNVWDPEDPPRS
jgi:hypothetical protein